MSTAPLIHAIQRRLLLAGYHNLATPLNVAGVEFAFTGAMRGSDGRALDLVLLIDTTTGDFGDRDGARVRQRARQLGRCRLERALAEGVEAMSETCRVLQVENIPLDQAGQPAGETAERQLDDRIRVLLPLTLPLAPTDPENGGGPAMDQLIRALQEETDRAFLNAVVNASAAGEAAVTEAAAQAVGQPFHGLSEGEAL